MARATPTGVSAMIDAYGRVLPGKSLDLGEMGVIDAELPPPAPPTLYRRWGEWPFVLMMGLTAALAARIRLVARLKKRQSSSRRTD